MVPRVLDQSTRAFPFLMPQDVAQLSNMNYKIITADLIVKSQESREIMSIMTKTGKNRIQPWNPKLTLIKWSLRHPKYMVRNWAQTRSQRKEKQLKNEVTFLIEKYFYIALLGQVLQKYSQIIKIQIYHNVPLRK